MSVGEKRESVPKLEGLGDLEVDDGLDSIEMMFHLGCPSRLPPINVNFGDIHKFSDDDYLLFSSRAEIVESSKGVYSRELEIAKMVSGRPVRVVKYVKQEDYE
ncbi:hypothetical protein HOD75_03235 [archaeon]|jgi:hypothetical protein|nr:hypothetical protein [archaeon]MBT4241887.1 hypothetical protein [archaeon]MBT4418434.1 hypothetical protein [archaeon]